MAHVEVAVDQGIRARDVDGGCRVGESRERADVLDEMVRGELRQQLAQAREAAGDIQALDGIWPGAVMGGPGSRGRVEGGQEARQRRGEGLPLFVVEVGGAGSPAGKERIAAEGPRVARGGGA